MKTLELKVPESVNDYDVKMHVAGILFESGELSSGQAADLVGISKRKFIETIGQYGYSVFSETIEDIQKSLEWLKS